MKDEVQSVLRLATERYGDAAQSTWPYSPGPRQQGDAQEGVRGGGALAAGLAAAYPGWRNGVVTGDMRRAIKMRGVQERLVGATLRAWHRHIVHERRLTWRRDCKVEGVLRRMNGIDTVADSVARRKRDMAAWRRGVAAGIRGQEGRRDTAAAAATAAEGRRRMQQDMARWTEDAPARTGVAAAQSVSLWHVPMEARLETWRNRCSARWVGETESTTR